MSNLFDERNQKIIRKIKGLLLLSENNTNEEEAQSAFLMAQKLMLKHDISTEQIDVKDHNKRSIEEGQVTVHKKLYWWERQLANVIGANFRVKTFINWRRFSEGTNRKSAVCFMGYDSDVRLAKEMYLLAYEAISYFTNNYVEIYYLENDLTRTKSHTVIIKDSYMRGFLEGLKGKFDEQIEQMREQTNALMVLVPKEVEQKYEKEITGKGKPFRIPSIGESQAYQKGYEDGNSIDYTKSTIDEDIL